MNTFKKGDIVCAEWICTMVYCDFFRVESTSEKSVVLVELGKRMTNGGGMRGYEVPTSEVVGEPVRKRISIDGKHIQMHPRHKGGYAPATLWDGEPKYADYWD